MIQITTRGMRKQPQGGAPGSATSATTVHGREGVAMRPGCIFVAGEGWVRWRRMKAEVDAAFENWRMKKALQGVMIAGGAELREADIREAMAKKSKS